MYLHRIVNKTPIKYHLMVLYSLLFFVAFAAAGWVIFSLVRNNTEEQIHKELALSAKAIETSIKTSVSVSIRNHLRAVAEKNREIVELQHKKFLQGTLTLHQAKNAAAEILLSQRIGDTGYIYAIQSNGVITVHPNKEMRNRDMSFHWLAREQKERKEGFVEYEWKNPGEEKTRPKALYMVYFQPWDWIISATSYREEFLVLIDIDDFDKAVDAFHFGDDGSATIIAGNGEVILNSRKKEGHEQEEFIGSDFRKQIMQAASGHFFRNRRDPATGQTREELVYYLNLSDYDWVIAASVYLDVVYKPLRQLQQIVLLTIFTAVLLILPLSLYLGASITKPLTRLAVMMRRATKNDYHIVAEENAKGEVGVLAKSFNRYIRKLRESRQALEGEVSERIHAEQQLMLFAKVFENALEGICITDAEGNIVTVNQAFTEITGYQKDEVVGKNPRLLKSDKHDDEFYRDMWHSLRNYGHWSNEIWNRRKDGEAYPEILSISSIASQNEEITHYVAVFHDITDMKLKEEQIKYQAYHDALTGLPNRALAKDRLMMCLAAARRKNTGVTVLFMDLDNFKNVNDSLGHAVGDVLLQEVGKRLLSLVREEDTVARLGGDEFQVIGTGITGVQQVVNLANRIIQGFAEPFYALGHELFATISVGASIYPQDGEDAEVLTKNADVAMYQAKQQGKNTFSLFTEELSERALRRMQLEAELRAGLQNDEFTVFYQPKINPASGEVLSVEALVRWQKADGTLVSPAEFIPLAEETGLITSLGEKVLENACETVQVLKGIGCREVKVAVNLSPYQFQQPDLVKNITDLLYKNSMSASQLELEITESTMMTNVEDSVAKLNLLVDAGISISIDDFGTGYSSLYYLKVFPIDLLKIDRSFIKDITKDPTDAQIVETIILMARNLGIGVVAEGVETKEQLELLKKFGCELIQGYYFSPPLPLEELISYLKSSAGSSVLT